MTILCTVPICLLVAWQPLPQHKSLKNKRMCAEVVYANRTRATHYSLSIWLTDDSRVPRFEEFGMTNCPITRRQKLMYGKVLEFHMAIHTLLFREISISLPGRATGNKGPSHCHRDKMRPYVRRGYDTSHISIHNF